MIETLKQIEVRCLIRLAYLAQGLMNDSVKLHIWINHKDFTFLCTRSHQLLIKETNFRRAVKQMTENQLNYKTSFKIQPY